MSGPQPDIQPGTPNSQQQPPLVMHTKAHNMTNGDFWPNALKHKTEIIQEQLDVGLYTIKRYAFYLQKLVEAKRPALMELKRVTEYETKEKSSKAAKDAMSGFVANYTTTQTIMASVIDLELAFLTTIDQQAVSPILNWLKMAEKRLEQYSKKLTTIYAKQKDLLTRITKSRAECHKQWSGLQASWKESEKADQAKLTKKNGTKEFEEKFKKYSKEIQKTYSVFNSFENEVKEANEQQGVYWNEELPQCVKDFEQLESERLQTYGLAMEAFRNAQYEFFYRSMEVTRVLDDTTGALDGMHEMKSWTDSLTSSYGFPVEPEFLHDFLPCEYTRVQQGDDLQHLLSIDLSVAIQHRNQTQISAARTTQQHNMTSFSHSLSSGLVGAGTPAANPFALPPNFVRPSYSHAIGKAVFDYPQNESDDLSMQQGEYIAVLDMPLPTQGEESTWWIGAKFDPLTGKILSKGIFPSNYITFDC